MSEKRRGLGRGLGALIPNNSTPPTRPSGDRPVDVFFPGKDGETGDPSDGAATRSTVAHIPDRSLTSVGAGGPSALPSALLTEPTLPMVTAPAVPTRTSTVPAAPAPEALVPAASEPEAGAPVLGPPAASQPAHPSAADPPDSGASEVRRRTGDAEPSARGAAASNPSRPDVAPGGLEPDEASVDASPVALKDATGTAPADVSARRTDASRSDGPELVPVPGAYFAEVLVTAIRPNPKQPRQDFDEDALAELVHSIREVGVLQPVVVRPSPASDGEVQYELIMGERRLRACAEAGLERIPAIVRDTQDDALLRDALLENLHRSQLNALEEAAAYQQLLDDFGCTHEELATRIGRSRPQISNTLRLLKLPPLVQRRVAAGVLSAGHARALLGLEDAAAMERLAQRIVAEGLSVRAVEEVVALGDGPGVKPVKKRPRAGAHRSELDDLAARLGDRLDTKVAIALGRSKGRLSIDFASVEDLNRILGALTPDLKGLFSGRS